MRIHHAALSLLLSALMPMSGLADDGAIEINQACAVDGGCFAGDSAGFPVTITNAGSYRLTGNLDVTVAPDPSNTTAIEIDADGTFLDLNGHTISGPVDCTGTKPVTPSDCTPTGSGVGISTVTARATIRNGSITGMGAEGVDASAHSEFQSLYLRFNGSDGLVVGDGSTVTRVRAILNGGDGIDVQSSVAGATLVNTVSFGNGGAGFRLGPGSVVRSSNAYVNGADGFLMSDASTVIDSASRDNRADGIDCGTGGAIKGNIIAGNLDLATRNCFEIGDNFCDGDMTCP